ncbi:MAG: hypothetical protein H6703_13615 [Myxococcales bacterium]|nr:hypothetical protein [Myxococcales bacterium]
MKFLDLDTWPRRAQFELFRRYELPFFNVCAEVEATATRAACRARGVSFDLACWFACQRVVNAVEPYRYRLRGERVVIHEVIGITITRAAADDTFVFCHIGPHDDFAAFVAEADAVLARQKPGAPLDARPEVDDVIHGTTLPWLRFTSLSHARRVDAGDSVPKIAFGRCTRVGEAELLPVSVEVHHALMDGVHVARFFERLGALLAAPDWLD